MSASEAKEDDEGKKVLSSQEEDLMDAEYKKDAESITNNCKYFGQFLGNLRERDDNGGLCGESLEAVRRLRDEMEAHLRLMDESDKYKNDDKTIKKKSDIKKELRVPEEYVKKKRNLSKPRPRRHKEESSTHD